MRRSIAIVSAAVLGLALSTPGAAHAGPATAPHIPARLAPAPASPAQRAALAAGVQAVPKAPYGTKPAGPNPFLADLPAGARPDYAGWANYLKAQAPAKARTYQGLRSSRV